MGRVLCFSRLIGNLKVVQKLISGGASADLKDKVLKVTTLFSYGHARVSWPAVIMWNPWQKKWQLQVLVLLSGRGPFPATEREVFFVG